MTVRNNRHLKKWPTYILWGGNYTFGTVSATVGEIKNGNSLPNYRSVISSGRDATTSYTRESLSSFGKKGLLRYRGIVPGVTLGDVVETNIFPPVDLNMPWFVYDGNLVEKARQLAAIRALKNVKNLQYSYSGLTILGELRETVRQLKSPCKSLFEATAKWQKNHNAYLKRKALRGRNVIRGDKVISDLWLEFAFGVQPLVHDIHDICTSVTEIKLDQVTRVYAAEKQQNSGSEMSGYNCGGYMIWGFEVADIGTATAKYVVGVRETDNTDRSPFQRIVDRGGFTLSEVIPAAWELVPYSFLVDYFVNIGDVLEASLTSTRDIAFSSLTRTYALQRRHCHAWGEFRFDSLYYGATEVVPFEAVGEKEWINRVAALPSIDLGAIQLKAPHSLKQIANMGALLIQKLK